MSSPERSRSFEAATLTPPAKQPETCECEPCVILALRSWNEVEVSIKHRVYGLRVLCLFLLLFLHSFFFFSFSFLHYLETGKVKPPPPNGHARILVNAEISGGSFSYWLLILWSLADGIARGPITWIAFAYRSICPMPMGSIRNDVTGENGDSTWRSWRNLLALWSRTSIHQSFEVDNRQVFPSYKLLSSVWKCSVSGMIMIVYIVRTWSIPGAPLDGRIIKSSQLWMWLAQKLFRDHLHVEGRRRNEGRTDLLVSSVLPLRTV